MRYLIFCFFLLVSGPAITIEASGQSAAKLIDTCVPESFKASLKSSRKYNLVMISHAGCGHCLLAMKDLNDVIHQLNMAIHVIDFGEKEKKNLYHSKYYSAFNFIEINKCLSEKAPDFYPQFVLYDPSNKIVWTKKGWFKSNLDILEKKVPKKVISNKL